jgi:hypothetical protein
VVFIHATGVRLPLGTPNFTGRRSELSADESLFFQESPEVVIATNKFVNVPTLIQYESTPIVEVVKHNKVNFAASVNIYHQDGTYLAKAIGSRLVLTHFGKKANLQLKHLPNLTACELDGKTLFEMRREGATSLHSAGELHAPEGIFIRYDNKKISGMNVENRIDFRVLNFMENCTIRNCKIGILYKKDGSISICTP